MTHPTRLISITAVRGSVGASVGAFTVKAELLDAQNSVLATTPVTNVDAARGIVQVNVSIDAP